MFVNKKISKMQSKEVDTITGNRIIADFMEWVHHEDKSYDEYEMSNLKYHSSWDWLMGVVEKIEELGYDTGICGVMINGERLTEVMFSPVQKDSKIEIHSRQPIPKIELTWQSVIQFIKWYNI